MSPHLLRLRSQDLTIEHDRDKANVLGALRLIHSAGVAHGDLHEGNILPGAPGHKAWIIAFGHAEPIDEENILRDLEAIDLLAFPTDKPCEHRLPLTETAASNLMKTPPVEWFSR